MKEKLNQILDRYKELELLLADPKVISDSDKLKETAKEHTFLNSVIPKAKRYLFLVNQVEDNKFIIDGDDEELKNLALEDNLQIDSELLELENQLKILLIPEDPNDSKNTIIEIRAGTGGEEAALFAADLFRMYSRFAERNMWNREVITSSGTGIGGFKEIIFSVKGKTVYGMMKFESGVHRVQRVPKTETGGRLHTSAATVAVLPEAEDAEIDILESDLKIDTYRASGAGGQHVNKTDSAIRITHEPSGVVSQCQSQRSQHQNKDKAMAQLRAKLYEIEMNKRNEEKQSLEESKADIGWGSQIRSYVLDSSRIKDLRTGVETTNCSAVLDGGLDFFIEASLKENI